MADNYLERRMEDYRAGRLRSSGTHRNASAPRHTVRPASAAPQLDGMRVLIITPSASASPRATDLVKLLRSQGCRVAFTDTDTQAGNRLAQATGSQCHPIDPTQPHLLQRTRNIITQRWGGIDATINLETLETE